MPLVDGASSGRDNSQRCECRRESNRPVAYGSNWRTHALSLDDNSGSIADVSTNLSEPPLSGAFRTLERPILNCRFRQLPAASQTGRELSGLSREYEVERNTDADHGDGVEQRDNEKHLRPQHRSKLGLPRGTLKKLAAEIAHSDGNAKSATGDH